MRRRRVQQAGCLSEPRHHPVARAKADVMAPTTVGFKGGLTVGSQAAIVGRLRDGVDMDTTTLLIVIVVLLILFGGGGWYWRGRR